MTDSPNMIARDQVVLTRDQLQNCIQGCATKYNDKDNEEEKKNNLDCRRMCIRGAIRQSERDPNFIISDLKDPSIPPCISACNIWRDPGVTGRCINKCISPNAP